VGQEAVIVDLVLGRQREACAVGVTVDVVGLQSVKALAFAGGDTVGHDSAHIRGPDVDPVLSRPAVASALVGRGKAVSIGAPVLIGSGRDVANGLDTLGVHSCNEGRRGIHTIHVVHLNVQQLRGA